ncbi:MAG: MBOAT family protein, partial [Fibrobacteraceae bacterium]|nr:MBOAT family protein [Fibrobacteraceae bacterium]
MLDHLLPFLHHTFAFDPNSPLLFTQFYFWGFFAVVFAVLTFMGNRILLRNAFLFFTSMFFYYKTSGSYVCILAFCVVANYFIGKWIENAEAQWKKKLWMIIVVIIDLLVLSYFKYAYFFLDALYDLTGIQLHVYNFFAAASNTMFGTKSLVDTIILPVGISFFTFQAISYCVDIYRGRVKAVKGLLDFGFYLTFFPQLVAGPIVRADRFIPQLHKKFFLPRRAFGIAVFWILNGLAKKVILSDYLATNFVDRVFETPLLFTGLENLIALFAYSLQVYADFSGYTDIAIGVALLMGFRLPQNFNSPYKATSPTEFWRRWHMSLSSWLRDYLYIPLGGNRGASFGTYFWIAFISLTAIMLSGSILVGVGIGLFFLYIALYAYFKPDSRKFITTNMNAMTTQVMGGLWHGASWNFIIWGGLNGFGQVFNKIWVRRSITFRAAASLFLMATCAIVNKSYPMPVLVIATVWFALIFIGVYTSLLWRMFTTRSCEWVKVAWNVSMTFIFITFTRLFFRAGSNLDPAEANEVAWSTAKNMINQMGTAWKWDTLGTIAWQHINIILVFIAGMLIHWIPKRVKSRYRIMFASQPIPLMVLSTAAIIFIIYQFMSA